MTTTRKSDSANSTLSPARAAANLKHLRTQIDKLDIQILKLINERAALAADIGRVKNDHGSEVFSPAREEEVLKNVLEAHEKGKGPLDSETVRQAFAARGIVALKGDWTTQNPEITALLQQFGRSGVPLYLLYGGKGEPVILPQLLTAASVLDALGKV